MAYKTELQNNNTDLQSVLETVRNLPEAGGAFVPVSVIADSQSINVTYTGKNGVETTKMDGGVEINVEVVANSLLLCDRSGLSPMDGGICEGKAALVLRGQSAVVDGIVFQNMRVPDGNGAGIRLESGDLTVTNSVFRNSEQGLLTANDPNGDIVIERSTFRRLGRCDRGLSCAHSIYVGDYGSLKVTQSRFEMGSGGHYIKSRAPRITVSNSSFDDTHGRATNYMIDLPAGASGVISSNVFVQGQNKENYSAFIAVAAEGKRHSSAGLNIHSNHASLAKGVERKTTFVADWGGDQMRIANNSLSPELKRYERR